MARSVSCSGEKIAASFSNSTMRLRLATRWVVVGSVHSARFSARLPGPNLSTHPRPPPRSRYLSHRTSRQSRPSFAFVRSARTVSIIRIIHRRLHLRAQLHLCSTRKRHDTKNHQSSARAFAFSPRRRRRSATSNMKNQKNHHPANEPTRPRPSRLDVFRARARIAPSSGNRSLAHSSSTASTTRQSTRATESSRVIAMTMSTNASHIQSGPQTRSTQQTPDTYPHISVWFHMSELKTQHKENRSQVWPPRG